MGFCVLKENKVIIVLLEFCLVRINYLLEFLNEEFEL